MNYKKFENKSAARLGNFGDNSAFGGSVVNVGKRKIHIEGGVEKSIWDAYKNDPKKAESILAARIGVTPETASINEKTGYREYNKKQSWWDRQMGKIGEAVGLDDDTSFNVSGPIDLFKQTFQMGKYDPLEQQKSQLGDMLDPSIGSIVAGTKKMEGFLDEQLEGEMDIIGEKRKSLWEGVSTVQDQMGANYQNIMNTGANTGLATTAGQLKGIENIEKQGDLAMSGVATEQKLLKGQQDQLVTEFDINKLRAQQAAEQSIQSIIGDYMAATGEPIGDQYVDMLTEIQDEGSVNDLERYT